MNTDDLEKRLQRQSLREIPGEWRAQILAAARARGRTTGAGDSIPAWRLIFARIPVAWGALAAVWIALIAINFLLFGSAGISSAHQRLASADEPLSIWHLQSAELQQLAGGDQSISGESPAILPAAMPRSPRSDRRRDDGVGEIIMDHSSNFVV
jgi:hypothetical protein